MGEEGGPVVVRQGIDADLSVIRAAAAASEELSSSLLPATTTTRNSENNDCDAIDNTSGTNATTTASSLSVALDQFMDASLNETILSDTVRVAASLSGGGDSSNNGSNVGFQKCDGCAVVTTERLIFWAHHERDGVEGGCDLLVHAKSIELHALSQEPASVYIQLAGDGDGDGDEESDRPLELLLMPLVQDTATRKAQSEGLFEYLSQLIALHPILTNDDENNDQVPGFGMGGGMGAMFGDMSLFGVGGTVTAEADDEMVVWEPALESNGNGVVDEVGERQEMLDHLDRLLVVPPELEIDDDDEDNNNNNAGQFDDADEEDDALL